jgi:DNA end-binding protein Ku
MRTSIWKGSISFGLINIPINVQSAEQDKDLHFRMIDERNMAPIQYKRVNSKTGKEVSNDKIVKGYEFDKNHYIIMKDEDFKKANPKATQTVDIEDIVNLEDIDFILFEKPYYLVPQKGGEKGYFLLQEALKKSKKVAIAKVVMHTKQHLCCIFPRGDHLILEIMRFAHQVREESEVESLKSTKAKAGYKPQELKMAEKLVQSMTKKWNPDQYKDTYYTDLKKHIDARIKAGKGKHIEEPEKDTETTPAKRSTRKSSDDLMSLLKESLKQGASARKKPKGRGESHVHH